jgi:hypothetical protein
MEKPTLTEPGVSYFLGQTLKECRRFKDSHTSLLFNFSMTVLLILVIGGFLVTKYKGKPSPAELARRAKEKQEYIVSKLQQIAVTKDKKSSMITDLPVWSNHSELSALRNNM